MLKKKIFVLLNSMGAELDNAGNEPHPQVEFIATDGDVVFNPANGMIQSFSAISGQLQIIESRSPRPQELFQNLLTRRTYVWDDNQMNDYDMSLAENYEQNQSPEDFSTANETYHITDVVQPVSNSIDRRIVQIADGSTLVFHEGGLFFNCKLLIGKNVKIIPNGTQQIFEDCEFDRLSNVPAVSDQEAGGNAGNPSPNEHLFVDSKLFATNFGAISDMNNVEQGAWSFRGRDVENLIVHHGRYVSGRTSRRFTGTINDYAWSQMVSFLKHSCGISVEFNGQFMGNTVRQIVISDCQNLELHGGTLLRGFDIVDCQNVHVHDIRFVGVHEVHDFPTILNNKSTYIQDLEQQIAAEQDSDIKDELQDHLVHCLTETYNCSYQGDSLNIDLQGIHHTESDPVFLGALLSCGLSGDGIIVKRVASDFSEFNVLIEHCHFEMRQGGVGFKSLYEGLNPDQALPLSHCTVRDCTFSHIYFQPVGSHAEHVTIENIQSDYCIQGLDISTAASHTSVNNCVFHRCGCGPKQEAYDPYTNMSHDNVVENCYFEITNDYNLENASRYILSVNKGASGDTFHMRNCEFVVNCSRKCDGLFFRSWRTELNHISIKIDIDRHGESGYDILYLLGIGGATPHSPIVELNHVDIECNAYVETLAYRGCSLQHAGPLELHMKHFNIHGTGHLSRLFDGLDYIHMDCCRFNIPATTFVRYSHQVNVYRCQVSQISDYGFIVKGIHDANYAIEYSVFTTGTHFFWIQDTDGTVTARRNQIYCAPLVYCKWDGSATISITENEIFDLSSVGTLLFNKVPDGQILNYDFWADGGCNELVFQNNIVTYNGSGTKNVVYADQYARYAHLFYLNFFGNGIKQFNTGTANERPLQPWQGMLHLEGGTLYEYDTTNGWQPVSGSSIV